jgi:predicted ribosome quality control (RQC) complex YloA/Tae2 family protein
MAQEIAYRSRIDGDAPFASLNGNQLSCLLNTLKDILAATQSGEFSPEMVCQGNEPMEFSAFSLTMYETWEHKKETSISFVVENFYKEKETIQRIRQKSTDLRKNVTTLLERNRKKWSLQQKQLKDTEKRERYKVYGELIQTYGYQLTPEDTTLVCINYYDNKEITIPIDSDMTPMENANKYFSRYNKLKRTFEAVTEQLKETTELIEHLETILTSLDIARQEEDLVLIKQELVDSGYMKRHGTDRKKGRKAAPKSKPLHYISSDGYDMYVGKNNYQNDELTFQTATGNDWWFHAKQAPGSHVIIKCNNEEPPISTFEEAASLAAYYSKNKNADKVEIDYLQKKNVKKPNGSKPGFVVYYTNYSMMANPDISRIQEVK